LDRNIIFAFLLILVSFLFFNSDFYNYTILSKEKPSPERLKFVRDSIRTERKKQREKALIESLQEEKTDLDNKAAPRHIKPDV